MQFFLLPVKTSILGVPLQLQVSEFWFNDVEWEGVN